MPLMRVSKRVGGIRSSRGGKARRQMSGYRLGNAGRQYLKSVLNPSYGGAKIPDSFGAKTCTLQLQREIKLDAHQIGAASGSPSVAPYGMGAVMQCSPQAIAWTSSYDSTNSCSRWDASTYIEGPVSYTNCKIHTMMRSARVVSAGLKVQFTGTTQTDKGTITVFGLDRPHLSSTNTASGGGIGNPDVVSGVVSTSPVGVTVGSTNVAIDGPQLRNLPINAFGPVRQGCVARYFPVDDTDLQFHPVPPSGSTAPFATGTVAALGFYCEGVDATASVIVQFTVNVECTVKDDSFHIVSTESSPVDTRSLAQVARVYLKKPQVRVGGSMGDTESINVYSR